MLSHTQYNLGISPRDATGPKTNTFIAPTECN